MYTAPYFLHIFQIYTDLLKPKNQIHSFPSQQHFMRTGTVLVTAPGTANEAMETETTSLSPQGSHPTGRNQVPGLPLPSKEGKENEEMQDY